MIEVGIFYADGAKVWKPLPRTGDFKTTNVLTLSFTTERGNRSALLARMWSRQNNQTNPRQSVAWWGEDFYYVGILPNGDFFTTQTAENDEKLITFSGNDGARSGVAISPRTFPADATIHKFVGAYLEPSDWARALVIFERDMF